MPQFSIIIPVYNRLEEMKEMLDSLQSQSCHDFELIVVEDDSTIKVDQLVAQYDLNSQYLHKANMGPSDRRNIGMAKTKGDYLIFFDSDCVLPPDYFEKLRQRIMLDNPDAFGGPDAAHESFSDIQKAINYTMTSFFTTGGIRGGQRRLNKYQPRSFNMGMSRQVYEQVGGFADVHPGEDLDLSLRIITAGFKVMLIREAFVYHKRRIDFGKFIKQVYGFGVVRVMLNKWYPSTGKIVYSLPSLFLLGNCTLLLGAIFSTPYFLLPIPVYGAMLVADAVRTNSIRVSAMVIPAAFCQLLSYGFGYLKSTCIIHLLRRDERKAFPSFFFSAKE